MTKAECGVQYVDRRQGTYAPPDSPLWDSGTQRRAAELQANAQSGPDESIVAGMKRVNAAAEMQADAQRKAAEMQAAYDFALPEKPPMTKAKCLDMAKEAVVGRGLNYGKPEANFERIAVRWNAHMLNTYGLKTTLTPSDVAIMMADMKLARLENSPGHLDSWVDIAGYAACGAEIAVK